jgi:hypothetical protein
MDKEKESTDLDKNTKLSSLQHADYSAPYFPLPNRVEAHLNFSHSYYKRQTGRKKTSFE